MAKTTGQIVKDILKKEKISQKELCNRTGISESARSKYLSSENNLRGDILLKLSKALHVSVSFLLGQDESMQNAFSVCKSALLARGGEELSEEEKKELINIILSR